MPVHHTSNSESPVLSPTGDGSLPSDISALFMGDLRSTLPNCSQSAVSYNGKIITKCTYINHILAIHVAGA